MREENKKIKHGAGIFLDGAHSGTIGGILSEALRCLRGGGVDGPSPVVE